jgi:pilus assembly protein FimV
VAGAQDSVPVEGAAAEPAAEAETPAAAPAPAPAKATPAAPVAATPAAKDASPGAFSNLWFALGAAVLAVIGILYMRRRRQEADADDETLEIETVPAGDSFADVKLTEQALEVEDAAEPSPLMPGDGGAKGGKESRGYGQRKHDEYASDETSDALAEAEIYIAYGRFPQAIDLLKNALINAPDNAAYRLKLLQLHLETGNRSEAMHEFGELEALGDSASIAAARAALEGPGGKAAPQKDFASQSTNADADLLSDFDQGLESDFSGLEIEEPGELSLDDELDLSADFDHAGLSSGSSEEDLMIATESNGLSTKLDLARAYMDMGDDDGARQILEEVAAEGNEELQAEARALLERVG